MFLTGLAVAGAAIWASRWLAGDALSPSGSRSTDKKSRDEIVYAAPASARAVESVVDREVDQNLPIAVGSFGLAVAGVLLYPPLVLLSIPGVIYNSRYTFASALEHLKKRTVNVDVLNALIVSIFILTGHFVLGNFPLLLSSVRRHVVSKVKDDSRSAITDIFSEQPQKVWLLIDGVESKVASSTLRKGDIVVARAGEVIPVDGVITAGMASVDQRILTGEAEPVDRQAGESVYAMTMVLSGRLHVQVTSSGQETMAARIGDVLHHTIDSKIGRQLQAEALVDQAILPTLLLSALSFPLIGVSSAAAILNAPPRDNLTIAGAVGIMNYLNLASKQGILIKDGRVLELLSQVDTVVFDKTGTLTDEQPLIGKISSLGHIDANQILAYAAAAEQHQSHPIARAILQKAADLELSIEHPSSEGVSVRLGYGLSVVVDAHKILVGSERFMRTEDVSFPEALAALQEDAHAQGRSLIYVAVDGDLAGVIELCPAIRAEVAALFEGLKQQGISRFILSGDHEAPTRRLAEELGADRYFAETLPEDKARLISMLQEEGRTVCFVGDGINDSIALKLAHVSISLSGASTAATDTAQVVLMNGSLDRLLALFSLAQDTNKTLSRTYMMIGIPPIIGVIGALFFGMGFVPAVLMNQAGFFAGLGNTMLPLLRREDSKLLSG